MNIKFEGGSFTSGHQEKIRAACAMVVDAANQAHETGVTANGLALIRRWFGVGNAAAARRGFVLFHKIITGSGRTYTFVDMSSKQYWCAPPKDDRSKFPPPPPQVGMKLVPDTVGGEVHTVGPGPDFRDPFGFAREMTGHAGSGMRIYLYRHFFDAAEGKASVDFMADTRYLAHLICHELTHKILDTVDWVYGPRKCKALAEKQPEVALFNADSWGCFYTNYTWPELVE